MENSFLPLSQKLIHALSWTLIHSLWQGLVLAVLTGLVLLTMRKSRPALRYHGLAGLLEPGHWRGAVDEALRIALVNLRAEPAPAAPAK